MIMGRDKKDKNPNLTERRVREKSWKQLLENSRRIGCCEWTVVESMVWLDLLFPNRA